MMADVTLDAKGLNCPLPILKARKALKDVTADRNAPTGESLQYLMTFTGSTINFGIALVGGALLGTFLSAMATRRFALQNFSDTADTIRHMLGGALMGIGGVTALGCTIGQGITGLSTLAVGSILATVSIVSGGFLGVKYLEKALDI